MNSTRSTLPSTNHDYDEKEKEGVYRMLKKILGSIVLLFSPLSADSLASLINLPGEYLRQTLEHLHSVIDVPEGQVCPIRLHHPSFRDFFRDAKRCTDRQLQVDRKKTHWALATACIRIMYDMLKRDICSLRLPGALAAEVDEKLIEQCIPAELQYGCSYWIQHLEESNSVLLDNGEVDRFLRHRLLFWLEALSLLRKISEGIIVLILLEKLVNVSDIPNMKLNLTKLYQGRPKPVFISVYS